MDRFIMRRIEQDILKQTTSSQCQICNVKLNTNIAQSHYGSKKHLRKITEYRENELKKVGVNQNSVTASGIVNDSSCQIPLVYQKPEIFSCSVCNLMLYSKSSKESHIKEFPHADLIKLKRDLLRRGIPDELYSLQGQFIYCVLCRVQLQCTSSVKSHCNSHAHELMLTKWPAVSSRLPERLTKWYFCNVCNAELDGTSGAEKHYEGVAHKRTVAANAPTPVAREDLQLTHATSQVSNHNEGRELREKTSNENIFKSSSDGAKFDVETNLKEQIFTELEKLVQALYYSNKLPQKLSLEYLKKVNRDVENLIHNHNAKADTASTPADNLIAAGIRAAVSFDNNCDVISQENVKKTVEKQDSKPQVSLVSSEEKNLTFVSENSYLSCEEETQEMVRSKNEKGKSRVQCKNIEGLLNEIVNRKFEVLGCDGEIAEIELLEEIETLLRQVKKENVPQEKILHYLKTINRTVDSKISATGIENCITTIESFPFCYL